MDLRMYHLVLLNTSAGKDSLAMLDHVYSLALAQGASERLQGQSIILRCFRAQSTGPIELGTHSLRCLARLGQL